MVCFDTFLILWFSPFVVLLRMANLSFISKRFNYRATHYMVKHGFYNFHNWFDERAWYPLGRIVGGTVGVMRAGLVLNGLQLSKNAKQNRSF